VSRYGEKHAAWEEACGELMDAAVELLRKAIAFPDVKEEAMARAEGYYRAARLIGERHHVTPAGGWQDAKEWVAKLIEAITSSVRRAS
jgi:hypothetical protein